MGVSFGVFVGGLEGLVRRGTRHGLRAVPKLYRSEDGERPAEVTALDFCPTGEPFFLVRTRQLSQM